MWYAMQYNSTLFIEDFQIQMKYIVTASSVEIMLWTI